MHVHALIPQAPVERLTVGIIGRHTRPREFQRDLVGICLGDVKQEVSKPGSKVGRSESSVQRDHIGTWGPGEVVGPLLHHCSPPLEQIRALIGRLHAFDDMGETGFGHFS